MTKVLDYSLSIEIMNEIANLVTSEGSLLDPRNHQTATCLDTVATNLSTHFGVNFGYFIRSNQYNVLSTVLPHVDNGNAITINVPVGNRTINTSTLVLKGLSSRSIETNPTQKEVIAWDDEQPKYTNLAATLHDSRAGDLSIIRAGVGQAIEINEGEVHCALLLPEGLATVLFWAYN